MLSAAGQRLWQLFKQTDLDQYDPERGQAFQRLVIAPAGTVYMTLMTYSGKASTKPFDIAQLFSSVYSIYLVMEVYLVLALLLFSWIVRRPGVVPIRRVLTILLDYTAITFSLSIGGEVFLPIFATLVWVTVGYGMRYGVGYLLCATGLGLLSIAITTAISSYWRSQPYVVVTLTLIILMVPAYLLGLLRRLHEAYQASLDANLAKSRFLAQASHDLRQPLHAISMFTWCLEQEPLGVRERGLVADIDRSLQSVSRLFQSLLDISTLDSGSVNPRPERVFLADLFDDVVRNNLTQAQWAGVELRVQRPSVYVWADPVLLSTILQNLVGNAIKYAPNTSVLLGCRRSGGRISVWVIDQGPGIATEHLPHIFDEFYQVRERGGRHLEGVGLGLSIVKRLSKLQQLRVSVRSVVARGTSVAIEGLQWVAPPVQAVQARPDVGKDDSALRGVRVLVIEDSRDVLQATALMLRSWGCTVQSELGLPKQTHGNWDLVLSDYDLGGGVTGGDCVMELRRHRPGLAAIIMTGHDLERVTAETANLIPVLAKPVKPEELKKVMLAVLSNYSPEVS